MFTTPGTCGRVSSIALEELGLNYESRLVRINAGTHKSPEFKHINPKGKVPALVHHQESLTENVAIISFLNDVYGGLLPPANTPMDRARHIADLCFCSATLHPLVTRIRMPMFFAGMEQASAIKTIAAQAMDEYFQLVEDRLQNQAWWYGAQWSAMDAYLYWVFWRVEGAGYHVERFPAFVRHARNLEARPATQRAIARENEAIKVLESEGVKIVHPHIPIGDYANNA
ncbi:glutathione S-transferase family protein [Pseudomaricurvus alcaniphilus]|uniref:glutathione S-transferase family protein n=1 Tax=Pseudomaricurvus alcaniphilus TaxID=1166482 RepID=UPI00140757AF|nr:glutathione S-transferase family protein [Pseudomaricurvus alcaniphilus]NHN39960.1 glutathione S-transferase family protein [Pseudomaricurvus alcaniphilus]